MPQHNVLLALYNRIHPNIIQTALAVPPGEEICSARSLIDGMVSALARGCRGVSFETGLVCAGARAKVLTLLNKPAPAASPSTRSASAKITSDAMLVELCNQWVLKLNIQACVENLEWCHEAARVKELFQARSSQWRWLSPRFETERVMLKDAVSRVRTLVMTEA